MSRKKGKELDPGMNIPQHIGIIMDGNGRWARRRGLPRTAGHRAGTDALTNVVEACGELGIRYLTIYTFSTENWGRPKTEVSMLMDLLVEMIQRKIKDLDTNNVRLRTIGNLEGLPPKTRKAFVEGMSRLEDNTGLTLILALNYGGRDDILNAAKRFARDAIERPSAIDTLDEVHFSRYLYTGDTPDPELIIRTGGDFRISNFLLWQAAYSELYITDTLWPDFNREALSLAVKEYNRRDRRFGKVHET